MLFEGHIEAAAGVSAELGYPAPDAATLLAVRNKTVMRDRLAARLGPACTGRYAEVTGLSAALAFAAGVGYPVVLKPAQLYHSLHVTPCADAGALRAAFGALMARLPGHADALSDGRVLLQVEEYLHGSDHSVDVLTGSGSAWPTPVVDVLTGAMLGVADFHHFARISPSARSAAEQRQLQDLAVRACRAIGLRDGVAHVEMIWTADGPRLVELGARPGGSRHFLLHEGRGIDLVGGYVLALAGGSPEVTPTRNRPVAVVTPYPATAGRLRELRALDQLRGLASFASMSIRARPGDLIGSPLDGGRAPLAVRLACLSPAALRADIQRIWELRPRLFGLEDG